MKLKIAAIAAAIACGALASAAQAEPWVDWSPGKSVTEKTYVHVEPGHMDDYLTGLRRTWVPAQAYRKAHGEISNYVVLVNQNGYGGGPNVLLVVNYPDMGSMGPDRTRALAERDAMRKLITDQARDAKVAEYNTYRKQVAIETWRTVEFPK
ncbi:MAG TPA: hypothetical protein VG248_06170 [Caulobacteraceae bacterium]|jgi:hypothetical protein|nr:hypothetical protein [Caulobacteraceae bacterium]